jgi:HEAT repeat protein
MADLALDPRQNDSRSVAELIAVALSDPHTYEHGGWDAVVAVRRQGTEEVLERATALCQSFCAVERRIGADILGQLGSPEQRFPRQRLNVLLKMLRRERESQVLYSVLIALGHLAETDAIGPAARLRTHPDSSVRYAVAHALTGYDDPLALNSLIDLTDDEDAEVRDWATFGLGTQVDCDFPALRDALVARLSDPDEVVRSEALIGLARRKDDRVLAALLQELAGESIDVGVIEAAELLADPQLHPALLAVWNRCNTNEEILESRDRLLLDRAILSCSPRPRSGLGQRDS